MLLAVNLLTVSAMLLLLIFLSSLKVAVSFRETSNGSVLLNLLAVSVMSSRLMLLVFLSSLKVAVSFRETSNGSVLLLFLVNLLAVSVMLFLLLL